MNMDEIGAHHNQTRKNSRDEMVFESFNDRQGSMMIDSGVMDGIDSYSPDNMVRESVYSKKGVKGKNTLGYVRGSGESMFDKKRKNMN